MTGKSEIFKEDYPPELKDTAERIYEKTSLTEFESAIIAAYEAGASMEDITSITTADYPSSVRWALRRAWSKKVEALMTLAFFDDIESGEFYEVVNDDDREYLLPGGDEE